MKYLLMIGALAGIDLKLKAQIDKQDEAGFPRPLAHTNGKIMLYRHHNAGFPFGFLQKYGMIVRMVPLAMVSGLTGVLGYFLTKPGRKLEKFSLALILGGALSNLYDRFVHHYVVDYFSFQFGVLKKVIFNIGDLCVFLGTGIWMFLELFRKS